MLTMPTRCRRVDVAPSTGSHTSPIVGGGAVLLVLFPRLCLPPYVVYGHSVITGTTSSFDLWDKCWSGVSRPSPSRWPHRASLRQNQTFQIVADFMSHESGEFYVALFVECCKPFSGKIKPAGTQADDVEAPFIFGDVDKELPTRYLCVPRHDLS